MAARRSRRASGAPAEAGSPPEASKTPSDTDELSFEVALERLEGVVDRLEQGDLELEGALAAFEEGVALTRRCAERLETAQRRIEALVREGDRWVARPFRPDEERPEQERPDEEPPDGERSAEGDEAD